MKFSTVFVAAVSALTASASPVEKRETGGVLMCTGANATGTCKYEVFKLNKCYDLEAPFKSNIKTFAPDGEDFYCFPHTGTCSDICTSPTGCTFGAVDFNYEHKYDLGAIQWNKLFESLDCYKNTTAKSS